ncbi:MAG TPA: RimK family alpha-L-glutamate ligase [Gallionella sp.]|nr:RimK family alpha-L-glutamate ligase [Gallionella sp.]
MNQANPPAAYKFVGPAVLMKQACAGADMTPLGEKLLAIAGGDPTEASADALMDLSTILQINGNREIALSVQMEALRLKQLYHLPAQRIVSNFRLFAPRVTSNIRLLAVMAPGDMMANTPVDFLLEDADISLDILYLAADLPFPETLPEHDVLFVAVGESDESQPLLEKMGAVLDEWPTPVLNHSDRISWLARDRAFMLLRDLPGVVMPDTARISRAELDGIADDTVSIQNYLTDAEFPLIVRPVGSHGGQGLEKIDSTADLRTYLQTRQEEEFYISRFIDYSNADGLFRKYRVVLIEGKPYAAHMGISTHWMIHYMNSGMTDSAEKRAEEERFMVEFDTSFAQRHAEALQAIHESMQLDYLILDCAETHEGELLLFEVDTSAVVHAMDPVDLFPYKQPQMRKVFDAFRTMLVNAIERRPA